MSRALVITAAVSVLSAVVAVQHVLLTGGPPSLLAVLIGGLAGAVLGLGVWSAALRRDEPDTTEPDLEGARNQAIVGQVASGVAHDFNNLLTIIELSGRILENEHNPEAARDVLRACAEGQATVGLLLRVARHRGVQTTTLELGAHLQQLTPLLRAAAGSATLRIHTPTLPCWVEADPVLLCRALLNLVVNAKEATRETIVIRLDRVGDTVSLSVEDDGDGIPDELTERVFEPFFSTKQDGSGLGLSVVQDTADQLGGQVSVARAALGGAALTLSLPLREMSFIG